MLVINVVLGFVQIKLPNNKPKTLSKKVIEEKFKKVLNDYGIEEGWIKNGKIQKGKSDSLSNSFVVSIPKDIPIAQMLKDISIEFKKQPVEVSSSEEKINGLTNLIIESGNYIKLVADFKYDNKIIRQFSSAAFLLNNIEGLKEIELENLLKNPLRFGAVLPLETSSKATAEILLDANKEYFIELKDNSDNVDFELDEDLNLDELKNHITKIISSFNSPKLFFIDKNESGISQGVKNFIEKGFDERGRKLLQLESITYLKGENNEDLKSLLRFHLTNLKFNHSKIFRISVEDWFIIQDELNNFLKKGNKILTPTRVL
ncbi:MAG: hypothetical protein H6613_00540 [Ignavibacteriales bacterium]|nr:hypothetical protein [Ignavibacteriales bacterium]